MPIPLESYSLVGNMRDFTGSIIDSLKIYDLGFIVIILLTLIILWCKSSLEKVSRKWYLIFLAATLGLNVILFSIKGGFIKSVNERSNNALVSYMVAPIYTVFGYLIYDLIETNSGNLDDTLNAFKEWNQEHEELINAYISSIDSIENKKNLVFIVCESLESWPIGLTVEGKEITPFLNTLVNNSSVYYNPHIQSQVRGGRSIDCQLMTLSGIYPMNRVSFSTNNSDAVVKSVPDALKSRDIATYLFTCDNKYVWNQASVAINMGVKQIFSREYWNDQLPGTINPCDGQLTDKAMFSQAIEAMKKGKIWSIGENAMTIWITRTSHNPFKIDESMDNLKISNDFHATLKDYLTAVNYVDNSLKLLIEYIQSRPDYNQTVIVITGDHEGLANHRKEIISYNKYPFVEENEFVPLLIINLERSIYNEQKIGGQIDIYPTLLDIMGQYDSYEWKGMGFSLLDPNRPQCAIDSKDIVIGDSVNNLYMDNMKKAVNISDNILKYKLLNNTLAE